MQALARLSIKTKLLLLFWSVPLLVIAALLAGGCLTGDQSCTGFVLGALGGAFVVSLVSVHVALERAARSMYSMIDTADAVGRGSYERRVHFHPSRELERLAKAINRMAENVAANVETITSQKEEIRAVLNGMREGVMVLDSRCRIRRVNRAMERIMPGVRDRLGRSPLEVLPNNDLLDACERMIDRDQQETETMLVVVDDEHIYEVNILRASEAAGLGIIAVFHDVSEIKRLESVRRDFAANVSHELRTPLTSIKGYAETLLASEPPPDKREKFLKVIIRNADHMSKMIGDLLSLAKFEAEGSGIGESAETTPLDPRHALNRAWESIQGMATERRIEMRDEMPQTLPKVRGDEDQLSQVFRNLLENAVKFGPESRPVIVRARIEGELAEFTVRDFGPGIPKLDQPRIFERFYSVQKHRRNEYGSTGLGLAITRHIVHNHGGTIRVESPPAGHHEGTAFVFTLHLA